MKKLYAVILLVVAILFVVGSARAQLAGVNIVYPFNGGSYPITDPAPGKLLSAYIPASFSVACDGDHKAEWGFDKTSLGNTPFYDQMTLQFVYKLEGGTHTFWVTSDCGKSEVKFQVGQ